MARKFNRYIILLVCVLALFLVALTMKSNEGFTSKNPLPTDADFESINGSSPTVTPTMQKIIDYIKSIPWSKTVSSINNLMFGVALIVADPGLDKITTLINSYSSRPTFGKALTDWNNLRKEKLTDSKLQSIIQSGPTESQATLTESGGFYKAYTYVFGEDSGTTPTGGDQSCKPEYKNVPGGTVETRCFD
jgi:hypothetical protein